MRFLILLPLLAYVQSRPQSLGNGDNPSIELEQQHVIDIEPITSQPTSTRHPKELDTFTQDILKKIDQINHKYGYTTTRRSPARRAEVEIPHFYQHSYDRPLPIRLGNFLNKRNGNQRKIIDGKEVTEKYYLSLPTETGQNLYLLNGDKTKKDNLNFLENQMLNNVKGIILKSQLPPYIQGLNNFNPLVQNLPFVNSFVPYKRSENYETSGYINNIPNMPFNEYKVDGYDPEKDIPKVPKPVYNGNTGIFNYLRILLDMEKNAENSTGRTGKQLRPQIYQPQQYRPKFIIESINKGIQVAEFNDQSGLIARVPSPRSIQDSSGQNSEYTNSEYRNSEHTNSESPSTGLKEREDKASKLKSTRKDQNSPTKDSEKHFQNPIQFILNQNKKQTTTTTPYYSDDDSKDIINENNKKLASRDNTGSGIFIHKLKVRKGGVAIAGPGGIATAGSGGTAIVGPNGYAYTHPDSLAIAGSGSKVIAVDPEVNLGDIIKGNHRGRRVGKVVAIGPVIYYNKG